MKFYEFKFRMFHILTSHLSPLTTKEAELAKVDLSYELFLLFFAVNLHFHGKLVWGSWLQRCR